MIIAPRNVWTGLLLIVLLFNAALAAELQAADAPPLGQQAWVQDGLPNYPLPARTPLQLPSVEQQAFCPSVGAGRVVTTPLETVIPHPFAHVYSDWLSGPMQLLSRSVRRDRDTHQAIGRFQH